MSGSTENGIVMYARQRYCPDVARARGRLTELGLPWTEYDTEADAARRQEMVRITGRGNVPTLLIGDAVLIEPSGQEIDDALIAAGYDITAPVAQGSGRADA